MNTLKSIIEAFKITHLEKWLVVNMEFGLNFIMPGYGKDLIMFTEYWKKTGFRFDTELAYSKKSYVEKKNGKANTYKIIKLYCKHSQFPKHCEPETVRMEIKTRQSKYLERIKIGHMGHLLEWEPYQLMKTEINQLTRDLLILDHKTDFANLTIRESRKLKDYLNPHTWYKTLQKSEREFYKRKQRYYSLLTKTDRNILENLQNIVGQKLEYLIPDKIEMERYSTSLKNTEMARHSTYSIIGKPFHLDFANGHCPITGISLEKEGRGARYIRTSTLRHLKANDQKQFDRIRMLLIPAKKHHKPKYERTLIAHMAKQIRNKYYNKSKIKKKGYNVGQAQFVGQTNLYEAFGMI
ncbi:hypothetical protein N9Y48_00210 [Zobellia sp.]|nr:hypothetical protein [Zobellia sp.]